MAGGQTLRLRMEPRGDRADGVALPAAGAVMVRPVLAGATRSLARTSRTGGGMESAGREVLEIMGADYRSSVKEG